MDVASQLDREWSLLARNEAARALEIWRQAQPQLRCFHSPIELLRFLHSAPAERTDAPLLALLMLARQEQLARRTLLQVLLPALKTQAERLVSPASLRDEVWEVLLCVAWETICRYPLERRQLGVATKLVLDVLHDASRELRRQRLDDDNRQPAHELDAFVAGVARVEELAGRQEPAALAERLPPEAVLFEAVRARVIVREDAELILLTRLDGIRLRLLARTLGVGYHALRQRRQRAEQRLRAFLTADRDVSKPPVSTLVSAGGSAPSRNRCAARPAAIELAAERAA